jgi:hypothetical protein
MIEPGTPWPPAPLEGGPTQKLDGRVKEILAEANPPEKISVIVQTVDGLQDVDRKLIGGLKGTILEDLWLIKGYSAELSAKAIETLSLAERVVAITFNSQLFR